MKGYLLYDSGVFVSLKKDKTAEEITTEIEDFERAG